jgi:hypothetical protein
MNRKRNRDTFRIRIDTSAGILSSGLPSNRKHDDPGRLNFTGARLGIDARKGRLIVIGNLLDMDALLSRLKACGTGFKVLEFPLIDKDGK